MTFKNILVLGLIAIIASTAYSACTKCGISCANRPAGWCADATDGCSVCYDAQDPYNPGAKCYSLTYWCGIQCVGNATFTECVNNCVTSNTPTPKSYCDKCQVSCVGGAGNCGESFGVPPTGYGPCTKCYTYFPGFSVCGA